MSPSRRPPPPAPFHYSQISGTDNSETEGGHVFSRAGDDIVNLLIFQVCPSSFTPVIMSVNKSVRAERCNVRIYTHSLQVATIYQRDGFLRVKDVVYELELCLVFDKPNDDAILWQPALLSKDGNIIILDQQDITFGMMSGGKVGTDALLLAKWMVFPISDNQDIADPTDDDSLVYAWKATWSPNANGIMLDSTLYSCFNQRLWSIHPETRKFRAFIDIPYLNKFHGKTVTLSREIDDNPLRYHYDICIFENTVSPNVPAPLKLTDVPSYQATAHPPSPPPSKPGSEERTLWPFSKDTSKVPGTAQQLIEDISDNDGYSRGRSRKRRRCTSSEDGGDLVIKWQRLE
ncbi:hypothetical protein VM1G_11080 [Cytospora mali]|uniref:Uncharacterized protein n=1 Tax=Cytospora mali TaxID=578113 RepID=A0A194VK52_CYTMA|nr:hypothetical protein VM1G_11080 [Valsa mali]